MPVLPEDILGWSRPHTSWYESPMTVTSLYLVAVIFVATLVRSAFGFGEALIAVPLLALRIPVRVAAPLAVMVSVTVAAVVVAQDWRKVHLRAAGWLVAASALGIPAGLLLLTRGNEQAVKATLAVLIVAFSAYSLLKPNALHLRGDHPGWLAAMGFCSGVLGGAYGMNGPPLVIYGSLRRWSAEHFRATLQGYFLPASLLGLLGYWLAGLCGAAVIRLYLVCLPAALAAIFLGRAINRRLQGRAFLVYVHIGLVAVGIALLAQALAGHH